MPKATIGAKPYTGGDKKDIPIPNQNGRAAAADSDPVVLSTEDKAALDLIAGVSKGAGNVDATTQRMTMAADSPGVANLATIATNTNPGAAGDTPPALATNASGTIGWLRKIVDTLAGILQVRGTRSNAGTDLAAGQGHLTVGGSDGTNLRALRTTTDGTAVVNNGSITSVSGTATATGVYLGPLDVNDAKLITYSYHSGGASLSLTHVLEWSDDNTNWWTNAGAIPYVSNFTTTFSGTGRAETAAVASATPSTIAIQPLARYVRIRVSVYTSGTLNGTLRLMREGTNLALGTYVQNTVTVSGQVGLNMAATTSGAASSNATMCAAGTNATSAKSSAACLNEVTISNSNATTGVWLKIYAKNSAPTVGTDVPVRRYYCRPNDSLSVNLGTGVRIATGLAWAVTTGAADSDTTGVAANEVAVNISYA